jgi:hypothetical protein
MDHSAFTNDYWEFFNSPDDDDSVTTATAQHARAAAAMCLAVGAFLTTEDRGRMDPSLAERRT